MKLVPHILVLAALVASGCEDGSEQTSSRARQAAREQLPEPGVDGTKPDEAEHAGQKPDEAKAKAIEAARSQRRFSATLEELDDEAYPHNPNIGYRSKLHSKLDYASLRLERKNGYHFDLELVPENPATPKISLRDVDISVFAPQAPTWIREDDYLTYIGLINQEWNRQQVHFRDQVKVHSDQPEWKAVTRVDVARNCLNAKLWEVIAYREEDGEERPVYHGWLDFPEPLYAAMFEDVNGIAYADYEEPLENWVDPPNKPIDLNVLRKVASEQSVKANNHNDALYPLTGARKKKHKNIIQPEDPKSIQAMLDDDTTFATFDQPGFYNRDNPRQTQLGRLSRLKSATFRQVETAAVEEGRSELVLRFTDDEGKRETQLIVGGLDLSSVPKLPVAEHHRGYKMPMGIANHSFYESYEQAQSRPVAENPYYAMLLDGDSKWLDSHRVGIDGPLLHWDAEHDNVLHVYILAFERHAFVGHFALTLPDTAQSDG